MGGVILSTPLVRRGLLIPHGILIKAASRRLDGLLKPELASHRKSRGFCYSKGWMRWAMGIYSLDGIADILFHASSGSAMLKQPCTSWAISIAYA